jgi:rhamnulokinase
MVKSNFIAADFGAGSGRVILGTLFNNKITLTEIHRFENKIIEKNNHIFWDLDYLFAELIKGLRKVAELGKENILGLGIDTWGVDYALFNDNDGLLNNPYAYRDSRTNGVMEKVFEIISKKKIYEQTGIQFLQFNTIYQLFAELQDKNTNLKNADVFLLLPDVFNFLLTGKKVSEYTIASTSQMLNAADKNWDETIINKLKIPQNIFPKIVMPGTKIGKLKSENQQKTKLTNIDVIAVGSHDTASAIASVPVSQNNWAYLSSGTWSLIGIEVEEPIINDTSFKNSFTNEGGIEGTIRYLKNTMGLWILEQSKKIWEKQGIKYTYSELFELALKEKPFVSIINPDDQSFLNPHNMLIAIKEYCKKTNQAVPETQGQFVRSILESLALKYKFLIEKINEQIGVPIQVLHIIGGGSQNELLNQFTANSLGIKVIAGPVEATAIGNILMQAIAKGKINNLSEGRSIIKNSFSLKEYNPIEKENWEYVYNKVRYMFI